MIEVMLILVIVFIALLVMDVPIAVAIAVASMLAMMYEGYDPNLMVASKWPTGSIASRCWRYRFLSCRAF